MIIQLFAVGHHHDGRIVQPGIAAQFGGEPQHGQRLTRSLGVPHHTTAIFGAPAFRDPLHCGGDRPVLLVAGKFLDELSVVELIDHIVPQDIQQGRRRQQAHDELGLSLELHAEPIADLLLRVRKHRLPFGVHVFRRV